MRFSLDVIRAHKGDCLALHYGTHEDPHLMLIDGGPKNTYGPHLKPRLKQIKEAFELDEEDPLPVDLLMVSHVDDDHIQGILELTNEMVKQQMTSTRPLVEVLDFWHNSFDNLIGGAPKELTAAFTRQFGTASTGGEPPNDLTIDADDVHDEVINSSLKVLASIKQGAQLRKNAEKLEFPFNVEFDGGLIVAQSPDEVFDMEHGLTFTVVGPMQPELKQLHKKHQEWLKELKAKGLKPADALSAFVDASVPNLSSIVVHAEAGGKTMLLTGDARGDKILAGLQLVGLLKPGDKSKLHVNLLKVPHHGSANNLAKVFFDRVTADHYVFSGDGQHGNPERESLQMLLDARKKAKYAIHLTYPLDEIDVERKKDWEKERAKEQARAKAAIAKGKKSKKPRAKWSPAKHSLTGLFKANPDFAKKLRIVEDGKPHVIDLLDKVDF